MARGFNSRRGSLPAPKRQIANEAVNGLDQAVAFGAAATVSGLGGTGFILGIPAATLIRTRGVISVSVADSGATGNVIFGAVVMGIASVEAFGVGLTALNTPLSDASFAWFVYEPFVLMGEGTVTIELSDASASSVQIAVDSRGQRKMKQEDLIYVVLEATQALTTTGTILRWGYSLRQQLKL